MKTRLQLAEDLIKKYNCMDLNTDLAGLGISRKGINDNLYNFCKLCLASLNLNSKTNHPPKFAIANGLFIGQIPKRYNDLTEPLPLWIASSV